MRSGDTAQAHTARGKHPLAGRAATARSKLTNGTRGAVLPGVDQRSAVARRFRDIIAAIVTDLGGPNHTTETRLHLIRRFAMLVVQAEEMEARYSEGEQIEISKHVKISSTLVRLAGRIGMKRVPKNITPDLKQYIEAQDTEHKPPGLDL